MNQEQLDAIAQRIASAAAQFAPAYRPSAAQIADAAAVLHQMLEGAGTYGVTFADLDNVADFPRMALQLVQSRDERGEWA
ncbi:hypothetical protein G6045_26585 [Streptomyces sp. YC504]|uniref:Uncharacterized protein n=1 Tax=Streptomyces mesophilus TaxID=1775132 RepID=A0A6G4XPS0_9ACTN|nr:hypothetical protein [Streptomyces mesophilus]NGO79192.1 hypothetical protein [Streptomyces mesophilus]